MRIVAACALVAVACGASVVEVTPVTTPFSIAHAIAASAQPDTLSASA